MNRFECNQRRAEVGSHSLCHFIDNGCYVCSVGLISDILKAQMVLWSCVFFPPKFSTKYHHPHLH